MKVRLITANGVYVANLPVNSINHLTTKIADNETNWIAVDRKKNSWLRTNKIIKVEPVGSDE